MSIEGLCPGLPTPCLVPPFPAQAAPESPSWLLFLTAASPGQAESMGAQRWKGTVRGISVGEGCQPGPAITWEGGSGQEGWPGACGSAGLHSTATWIGCHPDLLM